MLPMSNRYCIGLLEGFVNLANNNATVVKGKYPGFKRLVYQISLVGKGVISSRLKRRYNSMRGGVRQDGIF